ncbi:hypothetical protein [Hydrocarboniphaga sp.]|uniref:hypothetical protein n=1 Tax=Hydrocarboniphaga sp. TaxID=2033016 RepID=UPI003D0BF29A
MSSLIDLSLTTEVPLPLILDSPLEAARIARLSSAMSSTATVRPRAFRTRGKRNQFKQVIESALSDGSDAVPVALKRLCRDFRINTATAYCWFEKLSHDLVKRRAEAIARRKADRTLKIRVALESWAIPEYLSGQIASHDEVVSLVKAELEVSTCSIRFQLSRLLAARGSSEGE